MTWPVFVEAVRGFPRALSALISVAVLAGCDSTFEPLEESQWVFSIAGHLEPGADTQWVRVNALRPVVGTSSDPIDAVVTLEELETGTTVVMHPSPSTFRPILEGGELQYAFNFWTAAPIRPGFTYRLTATRSDGASSHATVAIPEDDITVTYARWVGDSRAFRDQVLVEGIPDLAMVLLKYEVSSDCNLPGNSYSEYQRLVVDPPEGGRHIVLLDWNSRPSFLNPPPNCPVIGEEIVVIASGDTWPFVASSALRDVMHPNMVGNVENGTGYLAGLLVRSFPRESCSLRLPLQEYCEVRYNSASASLEGTVVSLCTSFPIEGAQVVLEEVTGNRIRGFQTNASGEYRIEGIEPGLTYQLLISHPTHTTYESPVLTFEAAEDRHGSPVFLGIGDGNAC